MCGFKIIFFLCLVKYKKNEMETKEKMNEFLKPIREKKEYLRNHPEEVEEILKSGTEKAKEKASKTLKDVKSAMKINYFE